MSAYARLAALRPPTPAHSTHSHRFCPPHIVSFTPASPSPCPHPNPTYTKQQQAAWSNFFLGIYIFGFGVVLGLTALMAPHFIIIYMRFIFALLGRSLTYLCFGLLLLCDTSNTLRFITVILLLFTAVLYFILCFIRGVRAACCLLRAACCLLRAVGQWWWGCVAEGIGWKAGVGGACTCVCAYGGWLGTCVCVCACVCVCVCVCFWCGGSSVDCARVCHEMI